MKIHQFVELILQRFGLPPTNDQVNALQCFGAFLASRTDMPVMLFKGSAGTGKTSLTAAMVQTLVALRQKVFLMAPTGRAAKVLAVNAGMMAATIHRKIYRQKAFMGDFDLNDNLHTDTLFVVDEASMVGSELLNDLLRFVFSGRNCRLMLIGDTAQLPPVGEDESPALLDWMLEGYGATLFQCELKEVLRQSSESGILYNATYIRQYIQYETATELPKIKFSGFPDIVNLSGNEIIDTLADSYNRVGQDDTIVITRSNKNANIYNNGIRARVLDFEDLLQSGDQLMVVKNHYIAPPCPPQSGGEKVSMSLIANGDRCIVRRVRNMRELYGFHFADVTLRFPDYDDMELETVVLTDTLQSDAPALSQEQSDALFNAIAEDYADLPHKADRMKAIKADRYFNALQVKYAYAVTCHKSQGGQWSHVYVDQGYMTDDMLTPDYIHWLYTAFTRATEKLYLVNWSKTQIRE